MADRTLVVAAGNTMTRGFMLVPTDRVSRAGEPVNGLFAVARAVHRVLAFKRPARAVAVIERAPDTSKWPPLLVPQLERLPELMTTLGLHVVLADDELGMAASYARAALDAGDDAIVVGVDKRFAQLVNDRLWWYDANKDARYTPEIVQKRFTVPPAQVGEWLALVGDMDQLPGVKGIGAKGATQILETYGNLGAALAQRETIEGRIGKVLRAAAEDIPRELARARLEERALPVPLAELAYAPPAAAALNEHYERLGFAELLAHDGAATSVEVASQSLQLPAGPLAIHALIEDDGALTGIAVSAGGGAAQYVARDSAAWPALQAWLASAETQKLGHELAGVTIALARLGVSIAGITGDSAWASHLTQPSNWAPHDLALVAKHALGRALADPDAVRGVGRARKRWDALAIDRAAALAGEAADATFAIWHALAPRVAPERLAEYRALSEVLIRMELVGLIVDPDELTRAEEAFAVIEAELTAEIEALAGHSFNINSSKQLGTVLFEELQLPVVSHTKTGWSTSIEALERIEHAHPIVARVLRWRLLRRLRDSWLIALRRCIDADGRVHSRAHPARSFSGHLVNTNPDLARVPGRTPEMQRIRRAFVAGPERLLMSVDYHQLGLYVLAHLTRDPALVEPLTARADMHALTAAAVLDKPLADVTPDDRQLGKVVNFATFAGQGASALALQLGVPAAQAKLLIARFDARYAQVRAFQDEQLRLARERGYIVTLAGRHWPIGGLESLDSHDRSYAERLGRRATHEGSVADVTRRGLLEADRALRAAGLDATPLVQIVDEVLFEVAARDLTAAANTAAHAMRHAFELAVPLVVGVEAGPTWADLTAVAIDR